MCWGGLPRGALAFFQVEFEVNLVLLLQDSVMITENFPIVLYKN